MPQRAIMLAISAILCGCSAEHAAKISSQPPLSTIEIVERMKKSVVPIVCLTQEPSGTMRLDFIMGTGFFISSTGMFATARHVIIDMQPAPGHRPCQRPAIYIPTDGRWPADGILSSTTMRWFSFALDGCVLSDAMLDIARCTTAEDLSHNTGISAPPVPVVFDGTLSKDGTVVAFTGFPLQTPVPRTAQGIISGYGSYDGINPTELVIDKGTWPGASGSPVYLMDGRVIGIIIARGTNDATGLAFARTGVPVRQFLTTRQ
jgi:S1-C subfamily serine protease